MKENLSSVFLFVCENKMEEVCGRWEVGGIEREGGEGEEKV